MLRRKGIGRKGVPAFTDGRVLGGRVLQCLGGKGAGRKGVAACLEGKGQGITLLRRCVHIQGAVCARVHTN